MSSDQLVTDAQAYKRVVTGSSLSPGHSTATVNVSEERPFIALRDICLLTFQIHPGRFCQYPLPAAPPPGLLHVLSLV